MCDSNLQPLLGQYHDRELDAATTMLIDAHLRDCPECTGELAMLREFSSRIALSAASVADVSDAESARLHRAVRYAAQGPESLPFIRTAGLLTALAASVLIVAGVWLLDSRQTVGGVSSAPIPDRLTLAAPEWERVAVTLRADPRPGVTGESLFYALRYSSTVDWMLDGLLPKERKPWAKPG